MGRVGAVVQLVHGQDDDLIRWLSGVPLGGRNAALKQVLRCGLELPQVQPKMNEVEQLHREIDQIKTAVARLPSALRQTSTGNVDDVRLQNIEDYLREVGEWMQNINQRLEVLTQYPTEYALQPAIESVTELSTQEQDQRASKLKKAQW